VLVPLARANGEHAQKLVAHLTETPLSTRELSEFLKRYERSNKQTRERMISDPSLFVKAKKTKADKAAALSLHQVRKEPGSRIGTS
jgi:ParB family transcriptional regulator, chromosome partitioning protein